MKDPFVLPGGGCLEASIYQALMSVRQLLAIILELTHLSSSI